MSSVSAEQRFVVGIDIGGTFTDAVAIAPGSGETVVGKALTVPGREEEGAIAALEDLGLEPTAIAEIVHGHTVGLNALLSRSGARVGLLATEGYRDLLDMGRLDRPYNEQFNPHWKRPHQANPIVPRRRRRGVRGRIGAEGTQLAPLDTDGLRGTVEELVAQGAESFAICFVNAYLDGEHESEAARIVAEIAPEAYVQTSEVYPLAKEAERTTTVVLDAYTGPIVIDYLRRLGGRLRDYGFDGPIWIMGMNGGVSTIERSQRYPVGQLMSGPVGGIAHAVVASPAIGADLVTLDMGGTSTDVAVVQAGAPTHTDHWTVEWGIDLYLPMIEINTIGSGAGSVISVDEVGSLSVGPRSAGSDPGPACYGRGGIEPALTDAVAFQGLIQPEFFFAGRLELDLTAAERALGVVGEKLDVPVREVADAAQRIAVSQIAEAIRAISTYRGLDVRDFTLVGGGAAGPMVVAAVARELGMREAVVVRHPGQFSALGLAAADVRVSRSVGAMRTLASYTPEELDAAFATLEADARMEVEEEGLDTSGILLTRSFKGMYAGQTWDDSYPAPAGPYDAEAVAGIEAEFHRLYQQRSGSSSAELPIMVTALQVLGVVPRGQAGQYGPVPDSGERDGAVLKTSPVWWGLEELATDFLERDSLPTDQPIAGPAVIVEPHSTVAVPPGCVARSHPEGHLTLTWGNDGTEDDR